MGLGFQSLMLDLGVTLPVRVWTDSSAAIGICSRQGLGKLRHLDTHLLWIQQAVRARRIDLRKIRGETNPADVFTKHLASRDKLRQMVTLLGCRYTEGRAVSAPLIRDSTGSRATISQANVVEAEDAPCMPHLMHDLDALDKAYPSLSAPEDVNTSNEAQWEDWDQIYQRGLEIVEEVKRRMLTQGRVK